MSKNQIGNQLLYLLSEKQSLRWGQFKSFAEYLNRQDSSLSLKACKNSMSHKRGFKEGSDKSYLYWSIVRKLSSLAYVDIGGKTGETIVKIAPLMLAELPFSGLTFLLTGARSPKLLETIKTTLKNQLTIKIAIKSTYLLPDTVFIKPKNKTVLQNWLEQTPFQGNKLSDYIKLSSSPPAWNLLEFAGNITDYEKSLESHWFSGDKTHIKEIFDINSLTFTPFNPEKNSLKNTLSLVKIFYQENFYKYCVFSKQTEDQVEVQLDWGKLLILTKRFQSPVLTYNKRNFELISSLPLPVIFERGLVLLSGNPIELKEEKKKQRNTKKSFIFKNVSLKIASLVAYKLGQKLIEI